MTDTVEVVIKISKHNKNVIDRFVNGEGFDVLPTPLLDDLVVAVRNGTVLPKVLEDIKAEIIEHHEIGCDMDCKNCEMIACIEPKDVIADLEIIDKHINGKE